HVANVGLVIDPAGGGADLAGKHRVLHDPGFSPQLDPYVLREGEVGSVISVQMTDLPATDLEGELPTPARSRLDPRPRGHLLGDPLARCLSPGHGGPPRRSGWTDSRYNLK